jgi:hypothetical protein
VGADGAARQRDALLPAAGGGGGGGGGGVVAGPGAEDNAGGHKDGGHAGQRLSERKGDLMAYWRCRTIHLLHDGSRVNPLHSRMFLTCSDKFVLSS